MNTKVENSILDADGDSFVFYPSFLKAIKTLPDEKDRFRATEMILDYGCYGVQPTNEESNALAIFIIAKPNIDSAKKNRENGKKGGRPPKKQNNQGLSKSESNVNVNENEEENENATVNEKGNENVEDNGNTYYDPTITEWLGYNLPRYEIERIKDFAQSLFPEKDSSSITYTDYSNILSFAAEEVEMFDTPNFFVLNPQKANLLKYAVQCAANNRTITWPYIHGVLNNLKLYGITTLEEALKHEQQRI